MNGQIIIKTEPEFIIQDDENIAIQYYSTDNNDELVTDGDDDDGGGDTQEDEINYVDSEGRFRRRRNTNIVIQKIHHHQQQQHQQQQRQKSHSTNGHSHKIGITNETTTSHTKMYVCNVCNEQFERSYQLKRHYFIGEHDDIKIVPIITKKSIPPPAVPIMLHRANGLYSSPPSSTTINNKQLNRISVHDVSQQQQKQQQQRRPQQQQTSQRLHTNFGQQSQIKLKNLTVSTNHNGHFNEKTIIVDEQLRNVKKNILPPSNLINFKRFDHQNHEPNKEDITDFNITSQNEHNADDDDDDREEENQNNFDHIDYDDSHGSNAGSNAESLNGSNHVLMNVVTRTDGSNTNNNNNNNNNNQLAKKKEQFSHLTTDETEWSHIIICDIEGDNGESFEDIMFKCQLCNIYFSEIDLLDTHLQLHNPGISFAHKCELCDEIFSHVAILRNHVISHVNWKNRYKCVKCEKSFDTALTLRIHTKIRMMDGLCSPAQHKCIKCKKLFLTERLLIAHQFYHTGRKEYKCKYCPISIINDDSKIKQKTSNSHNIKEFIHWSSLQMHLQSNEVCKKYNQM